MATFVHHVQVDAHIRAILGRIRSGLDLEFLDCFHPWARRVLVIRLFAMLIPSSKMLFWTSRVPAPMKSLPGGNPVVVFSP